MKKHSFEGKREGAAEAEAKEEGLWVMFQKLSYASGLTLSSA